MKQDEIIEMARQFGLGVGVALDGSKSMGKHEDKSFAVGRLPLEDFVAFVQLVAAKEREACLKICDEFPDIGHVDKKITDDYHSYLIRLRGEA